MMLLLLYRMMLLLSEATKLKSLDEMHYVWIISWSEAATEKCSLKIDVPNFWEYRDLAYDFTTVFKNTCERVLIF